jgi:tetratricopeptide (TPR) repeat protein
VRGNHGECLTEETLTEYLEGVLDPALKAASEVHLIACDDCRNQLAFLMRVLNQEMTAEETIAVQMAIAQADRNKSRRDGGIMGNIRQWLLGVIAVAAILAIGVVSARFLTQRFAEPKSASEIVDLLLTRERPFEARMANEQHRAIIRTRGIDDPGVSYKLVAAELVKLSADAHQMGRFHLLQKEFVPAIQYLESAEREVGSTAELHNDLGVAYLESGTVEGLDKAYSEFRHALDRDPAFAPAMFNLALFYERTNAAAEASAQWKRYLQTDSKSDWAKEAEARLQGLSR